MNKLQLEFLFNVLSLLSMFAACYFLFWAFVWEVFVWRKSLTEALLTSSQNWLLFVLFLIATAMLNFLSEHPELLLNLHLKRKPKAEKKKKENKENKSFPVY